MKKAQEEEAAKKRALEEDDARIKAAAEEAIKKADDEARRKAQEEKAKQKAQEAPADMKVEITEEGTGEMTKKGDKVQVHYTGTLLDGTVFDSSKNKGRKPFEFNLGSGQVIKCWDQGFAGLRVGTKATLTCPPDFAYGKRAMGNSIPANSTLMFDIEVLDILSSKPQQERPKKEIKIDPEKAQAA